MRTKPTRLYISIYSLHKKSFYTIRIIIFLYNIFCIFDKLSQGQVHEKKYKNKKDIKFCIRTNNRVPKGDPSPADRGIHLKAGGPGSIFRHPGRPVTCIILYTGCAHATVRTRSFVRSLRSLESIVCELRAPESLYELYTYTNTCLCGIRRKSRPPRKPRYSVARVSRSSEGLQEKRIRQAEEGEPGRRAGRPVAFARFSTYCRFGAPSGGQIYH